MRQRFGGRGFRYSLSDDKVRNPLRRRCKEPPLRSPINMLSIAVTGTRNRASHLAPLAAAVGAAIISHRNEDLDGDTTTNVLIDNPPLNDWQLKLLKIDLSDAKCNIPRTNHKHCSCKSPFAYLSLRETLRWLDKTSSNATLESRYKVRLCYIFSCSFSPCLGFSHTCQC